MKVLALELSTARGSVAFFNGEKPVEIDWPNEQKHSGEFFKALQEMRKEHGAPEVIVVGLGPGSYAGTRIAISAAIGLQAASDARLLGIASVCAMPVDAHEYVVIGDARRQTFYLAAVRDRRLVGEPELLKEEELREKLERNDSARRPVVSSDRLAQFSGVALTFPSAALLALLAQDADSHFSMPPLQPMYLREPHITQPRGTGIMGA